MCPSFMATGEDEHSTRGRAVLLQSVISGLLPPGEITSERMHAALDLCLECKGCKGECPANVDMAKIKYEFLSHYHDQHGIPVRARVFGEVAQMNRRAARLRPLFNWASDRTIVRHGIARILGIDPRRPLPKIAPQRFSEWFASREVAKPSRRVPVALLVDTFTEYNAPAAGIAATLVLEAFGYRVTPVMGYCCGRPMISKGLLDRAAANARTNIAVLTDIIDRGIPVVGLEPSCLLTFRDEYPDMVAGADARRVAQNAFLLDEFLDSSRRHPAEVTLQTIPRKVLFHGHCHQKALVGSAPSLQLLRRIPGLQVEEANSGCCGMAGSFGFEKEHYDVSIKIAEQRLAPAIRALSPDSLVVAAGISCRQQIAHTTGREALHPAEVVARALPSHNQTQ